MEIVCKTKISERMIQKGDTVSILYSGKYAKNEVCLKYEITKDMIIDTAVIFRFDNEFGYHCGIGGFFGKEE